jgi:hypothetical protein
VNPALRDLILGHSAATPSAFSPSDISNLAIWLDAADASTLTLDGSNNVEQWNDKSGNGRHVEQSNATLRPARTLSSINGLTALTFDGTDDRLIGTFASIAQPATFFIVSRIANVTGAKILFDSRQTTAHSLFSNAAALSIISAASSISGGTVAAATAFMSSGQFNGASSVLRLNRSQVATGNAGVGSLTDGISLGISRTGGSPLNGSIAELVYYSKLLSAGEITSVEDYLAAKWGTP